MYGSVQCALDPSKHSCAICVSSYLHIFISSQPRIFESAQVCSPIWCPARGSWRKTVNDTIVAEHMKSRSCHVRQCPMCTWSCETLMFNLHILVQNLVSLREHKFALLHYGPTRGSWSKAVIGTIVAQHMNSRSCHLRQCLIRTYVVKAAITESTYLRIFVTSGSTRGEFRGWK
jgi:hypothetical protein